MAVQKKLSNLLLAVMLLYVTFEKAEGQCHTETWENAPDSIKDKLPGFVCKSGKYQVCDKESAFSRPNLIAKDTCGVKLSCLGKNASENVSMPAELFQRIKDQSVWIDMSGCGLKRVVLNTEDLLIDRQYEFHLFLADNKLSSINDITGIKQSLHLRTFDLSGNALKGSTKLGSRFRFSTITLLLNNNTISEVGDSAFEYVLIDVLDMSSNAIKHITADMFSRTEGAETLLFRSNEIVAIVKKPFLNLRVSTLDISGNSLQRVDAEPFSGLTSLKTLLLSRNKISAITARAFDGSNNLNYLDLSHNILENVPADVFMQLRNLRTLIMSHNRLVAVESNSFLGLSFSFLDLSNNPLRSLGPTCFNKTSVTKLDISGCEFEHFPQDTVRFLDENLKEVNLSGNQITSFPTVGFDQDFLLQSLDLSHNLMESVDCCWLGDNLKFLYLHGNTITTIEKCLFTERMFTLTNFSLAENPLDCCEMYWLKDIASAAENLLDSNTATCRKPNEKPFLETENCKDDSSSKTFKTNDIIAAVLGTFFVTLCLIGIACALIFVVRRRRRRSHSSDSALRQQIPLPDIPTPGAKKGEMPMYENVPGDELEKEYQKLHKPDPVVKSDKKTKANQSKTTTKSSGKGTHAERVSTADDMEVYQELEALPKDDKKKANGAKVSPTIKAPTSKDDSELFYEDTAVMEKYEDPVPSTEPPKKVTTFGKRTSDVTKPKEDLKQQKQEQNQSQTIEDMYENTQEAEHPPNTKAKGETLAKSSAKTSQSAEKGSPPKGPANAKRSSSTTGPLFKVSKREPDKQRGGVVKQLSASYDARM